MNRVATLSCKWRFLQASGFSLVLTAALCAGCGSNKGLTRSKAAEMIRNSKLLSDKAESLPFTTGQVPDYSTQPFSDHPIYLALEQLGYLKIEAGGPPGGWAPYAISLTAEGQSASREWRKETSIYWRKEEAIYYVPVATQEFVEVTGVSGGGPESHTGDQAHVEYSWKWVLTPIGRELDQAGVKNLSQLCGELSGVKSGSTGFHLYDDGWRLVVSRFEKGPCEQ